MAQLPTVVLGILIILLAVTLAVAGTALVRNRVPVEVRESHTVPLGLLNVGLTGIFGIIVGLTAFLVLGEYSDAQQARKRSRSVGEIYRLAYRFRTEAEQIQGLAASYAHVVVNEEWPLMEEVRTSPRADALRGASQYHPGGVQDQLGCRSRLLWGGEGKGGDERTGGGGALPSILWIALVMVGITKMGASLLWGVWGGAGTTRGGLG